MNLPKIGITLGDPGGIGPEVVLKALSSKKSLPKAYYIIFGSSLIVEKEKKSLSLDLDIQLFNNTKSSIPSPITLLEIDNPLKNIKMGSPSKENGQASFIFFKEAVKEATRGSIQAIVTAPISKHSWHLAGVEWNGHTDYLNQVYPQAIMVFWSERIKVALFSHHIPLKTALKKIKKEALQDFFLLLHQHIEKIQPKKFHFLVAGLNPHAGEEGFLGSEEEEEIIPAIKHVKRKGVRISGPFAPDIVFIKALGRTDTVVIALYHDQGLIPFKLESFKKGINVTLGLPFIRTSPDHGTALDIAGKGVASPESMLEAIKLACKLSPRFF
ncbi:MAG: 4-hydroxythreonine-4-phosphate dehydrogenase PdxA [Candidatus Aminicenantaceae bacterium]